MPNRNGLTTDARPVPSVKGKPDAQGSRLHEGLRAEQVQSLPKCRSSRAIRTAISRSRNGRSVRMRGIDTAAYDSGEAGAASRAAATTAAAARSKESARCATPARRAIGMTSRVIGPGFNEIATKYQGRADAQAYLSKESGRRAGVWGAVPMPPQAAFKDSDAQAIARWIVEGGK